MSALMETMQSQDKQEQILQPASESDLANLLRAAGLPIDSWVPEQGAKTVGKLFSEIKKGDSALLIRQGPDGQQLVRETNVAWVDVYGFDSLGRRWHLREHHQEFPPDAQGKVRKPQERELLASLGEKTQRGQTPFDAAHDGAEQELKLGVSMQMHYCRTEHLEIQPAHSYPGLMTQEVAHFFEAEIPDALFDANGYVVPEDDKTAYFVWDPAPIDDPELLS